MLGVKFCPPPLADNYASPAHTLQRRAHALKLDTELAATLPGEPKFRSRGVPPLKSSFLERRFSNKSNKMCNLRKQSYVLISQQIASIFSDFGPFFARMMPFRGLERGDLEASRAKGFSGW
jgi:hypothetical protein